MMKTLYADSFHSENMHLSSLRLCVFAGLLTLLVILILPRVSSSSRMAVTRCITHFKRSLSYEKCSIETLCTSL